MSRLSERTDLRPMAIKTADLRPGMVMRYPNGEAIGLEWVTLSAQAVTDIRVFWTGPDDPDLVQIMGEEVRAASELAAGDVIRVHNGWATVPAEGSTWVITGTKAQGIVRAYIDPAWERAQAEA